MSSFCELLHTEALERIAGYNHRIAEARARMYEEESEEDWDDREDDESYEDDSVPESLSPEQVDEVVSDGGKPEKMVFDETEEIIEGHPFHTDGAVRYIVSPDNPWYFEIDGVVFSRETGLLVRFPPEKCREYVIPDDERITGIGEFAFKENHLLEKITFNDRILYIGEKAFAECDSLKEVVLPDGIEYLGDDVFARCFAMKSAEINCRIQNIPHRLFYENTSLETVRYPDSVTEIVQGAFSGCRSLVDVKAIGETRMDYNVIISSLVEKIGGDAFCECEAIRSVFLPESTKIIGMGAFMGCISLKAINTEAVEEYGAYCFQDCISLESLTFGENTRKLGRLLLQGTDSLKEIRFSCAKDITCASDAFLDDKNYIVDTEAWLAVPRPYINTTLFFACVRNIAEGEAVSRDAATAAQKIMKRNRKKHYDWFIENDSILRWALNENILDGDDVTMMMKIAEAEGKTELAGKLRAWLTEHFSPKSIDVMLQYWEAYESTREVVAQWEEKQSPEEQERYREEREKAVQAGKDLRLEDVGLRIYTYNSLKRAGFNYLSEVTAKTVQELSPIRGLGLRGVNEVRQKMEQLENDGKMTFPDQKLIYRRPVFDDLVLDDLLD